MLAHTLSVPSILDVGTGSLSRIGAALKKEKLNNIVLIFGSGMEDLVGEPIQRSLDENGINVLDHRILEDIAIENIVPFAFALPSELDAIIGIGGGKAIDYAKYVSFLRKLPFISVPTSLSNDGFASPMSSVTVQGRRTTVPSSLPFGIVVDLDVIKDSPERFLYSGIGDLISNITALYDWRFEEEHGKAEVNHFAEMLSKKAVNSFVRTQFEGIRDNLFLKELVDSLTMNGIAMGIAGSSHPASGAEHLISHALDKFLEKPQLHGIQVGIATYLMSLVQAHRAKRIRTVLEETGFFEFARGLEMKASDFARAIDLAPSIKAQRYTYIHVEENRLLAKRLLHEDPWLQKVLVQ